MSIVTTLPVTPVQRSPFVRFFSPFVADIVAKATHSDLTIMLNTYGISDATQNAAFHVHAYSGCLNRLDINGSTKVLLTTDGGAEFEKYFRVQIEKLSQIGALSVCKRDILTCKCGKVEIARSALADALSVSQKKSLIFTEDGSLLRCKVCRSQLIERTQESVVLTLEGSVPRKIYPELLCSEIMNMKGWFIGREFVVSRNCRPQLEAVHFANRQIVFDSDFRWATCLGYIAQETSQMYLVVSHAMINHAMRTVSLSRILFPNLKIDLVVHPLVMVQDQRSTLSKSTIDEFLSLCSNPTEARFFMALGLHWGHPQSTLPSGDLFFAKKTSQCVDKLYFLNASSNIREGNLGEILQYLKRTSLISAFKRIRCHETVDSKTRSVIKLLF